MILRKGLTRQPDVVSLRNRDRDTLINSDLRKELKVRPKVANFPTCLKFPDFSGSSFECITVIMPHFHAEYGEYEITVEISTGIVTGHFPRRALMAVLEWYEINKEALLRDWELAEHRKPLEPIQPLE